MANVFGEVARRLIGKIFEGILWFGIAIVIITVLIFVMWFFLVYKRKFNIDVKIISKRAGDKNNILFDKAAILRDRKTQTKYFSLWNTRAKLPVPDFNILQKTDKGDYIELFRSGEDNFYYLLPPKIDRKYLIKDGGRIVPMSNQSSKMIDPDLAFWAIKRKSMNKGMFDPEKLWMKILPYIPHIVSGVLIIFILWILMSHLPAILSELRDLAETLRSTTGAVVTTG